MKSAYKKSLLIFSIIMSIVALVFLGYVFNSMIVYERNLVDNYIDYLLTSGKLADNVKEDLFEVSGLEYKNVNVTKGLKKLYKNENLKVKKNSEFSKDDIFAYDIKLNDKVITTVSLKSIKEYTQMAILKITEWEIEDVKTYFEEGFYKYEINIPKNYELYINNNLVNSDYVVSEKDVKGLDRLTKHIEISKTSNYVIDNLVYEPEIKILNEKKKEVDYKIENNVINIEPKFKEIEKLEDAKVYIKDDFDIMKLAENWSLFLTDDLKGSYHGFNKLTPYLIKDSYMYDMAYNWSHNVDILFVSNHRLKNPTFTNESIKNFIIYNDLAFSCEVYLEKNMVVSGKAKVDIMHDRLYFVYVDGGYKLVNMEAITD